MFVISDIHGHYDKLIQLIKIINPQPDTKFVFLGDYIDRGPDSKKVIEFLLDFEKHYSCIFLMGNHEEMLLTASKYNPDSTCWSLNGGITTMCSYQPPTKNYKFDFNGIPETHWKFFNSLQNCHRNTQYFFVHAGINPDVEIFKQTRNDLFWIREEFVLRPTNIKQKVIYGHTPIHYIQPVHNDKIGIDFGMGQGHALAALKLPECQFLYFGTLLPEVKQYVAKFNYVQMN